MRILVVEDEPRILAFLVRGLEAEGFAVDCAGDGSEALLRAGEAPYDVVCAGRLELDLARRQARIGAVATDLSDREFRLLHYLVLHAGEVISRERLLAEVWGYHFDPGSNVVEVCMRRLRKKLGAEAPIETIRHAGYRVAAA